MFITMFTKHHPKAGARPGTLVIPDQAPTPRIHLIRYSPTDLNEADIGSVKQLEDDCSKDSVTWIDVQGFGDKTLMQGYRRRV